MKRLVPLCLFILLGMVLASAAAAHGPTVDVSYKGVKPERLVVRVGDTVHFRNGNLSAGAVTLVAEEGDLGVPVLPRGGDHHVTFDEPGEYHYFVKEFPSVKGVLIVVAP